MTNLASQLVAAKLELDAAQLAFNEADVNYSKAKGYAKAATEDYTEAQRIADELAATAKAKVDPVVVDKEDTLVYTPTPTVTPSPIVTPTPEPQDVVEDIEDTEIPEGTPDQEEQSEEEDITEDQLPQGTPEVLPQTGTANEVVIYMIGLAIMMFGFAVTMGKRTKENEQ